MTTVMASKFIISNCIRSHLVIGTRHVPKDASFYGMCLLSSADGTFFIRSSTPTMEAITTLNSEDMLIDGIKDGSVVCANASSLSRAIDSFETGSKLDMSVSEGGTSMLVMLAGSNDDSQTVPLAGSQSVPPSVQMPKKGISFKCTVGALASVIGRIRFALPVSDMIRHYTFIKFRVSENSMKVIAGNGGVFARTSCFISDVKGLEGEKTIYIPAKEMLKVVDYLSNNFDEDDHVLMVFGKDRIGFECGNFCAVVSSAWENQPWPDENDVLAKNYMTKISAGIAAWNSVHNGIRAVFELENDHNNLCKTKLVIDKNGNKAVMATGSRNVSKRTLQISSACMVDNAALTASFSSSIFCEVIKSSKSASSIVMEIDASKFKDVSSPVIMRAFDDGSETPSIEFFFVQLS